MCQEYYEKSRGGGRIFNSPLWSPLNSWRGGREIEEKKCSMWSGRKNEKRGREKSALLDSILKRRLDASRTASAYSNFWSVGEKEASHIRLLLKTQARAQEYLHSYVSSRMWEEFAVCFLADFLGAFQVSAWRKDDFLRPSRRFLGTPLWRIITGSALHTFLR